LIRSGLTGALFLSGLLAVSACVTPLPNDPDELRRTWDQAEIRLDLGGDLAVFGRLADPRTKAVLARIPAGRKLPVVVYLHGCAGLKWSRGEAFFERLARAGYVLVAPDSFARSYRPKMCGSANAWKDAVRNSEIRFAAEQLAGLPWADQDKLVLMGHSEGGEIVAAYPGEEFKARIVSAAFCWRGIDSPGETLAISVAKDYWVKHEYCRDAANKLVIDGSTQRHWPFNYPEVEAAVHAFLAARLGARLGDSSAQ